MELKQVRYFVAVADAGSFSAGARLAFVTQPTLSAAISALEAELGFALFERQARGVVLTERGEVALAHARSVLRETENFKSANRRVRVERPLRLGLLPTLPPAFVGATLSRLRRIDAARSWFVEDAPVGRLRQRLAGGRYDAILTSLGVAESGHRQIELATDTQALAFPKSARPKLPISPRILTSWPLIVRVHCDQLQAASRVLDDWRVHPTVVARTDSDVRALGMVAAGIGCCLMPNSFRHDDVRFIQPEGVELGRRLGLEWIKGAGEGFFERAADKPGV